MVQWLLNVNCLGMTNWQGCILAILALSIIVHLVYQILSNDWWDDNDDNFAV